MVCYVKGSVIITINKNFEELRDIFADSVLASAIIDRIVHHFTVIKANGKSYKTKSIKKEKGKKMWYFFNSSYGIFVIHNFGILFHFEAADTLFQFNYCDTIRFSYRTFTD